MKHLGKNDNEERQACLQRFEDCHDQIIGHLLFIGLWRLTTGRLLIQTIYKRLRLVGLARLAWIVMRMWHIILKHNIGLGSRVVRGAAGLGRQVYIISQIAVKKRVRSDYIVQIDIVDKLGDSVSIGVGGAAHLTW